MKKRLYIIIYIAIFLSTHSVYAQERQILNQAESEYDIGRVDQALKLLQDHLESFEGNTKQSAYRLIALCYLSKDQDEQAKHYAKLLVKMNNYYNSAEDPARFQDLISQLKGGITATITTASNQSESINEAPAPITIITAEMIEELGYNKSLNQILAAYVPGIAEITSPSYMENLAMHSAYSEGQEHFLIMENGHRLNTRFNNTGPTSYSISTEKIDHIEVLRGPASSLYGNVALSAVVNIITKSGKQLNGIKAKYGYATYNTHKADLTIGTQFMDADIFAWASIYNSDGQIRHYNDGEKYLADSFNQFEDWGGGTTTYVSPDRMVISGYKDAPAYDVGLDIKLKGFDLLFSKKNVKRVYQNTTYNGGYDYDRYCPIYSIKPGYGTESTHAEIAYTKQLRSVRLNASVYSDWYTLSEYTVYSDSVVTKTPVFDFENLSYVYDENGNMVYDVFVSRGSFGFRQYKEHSIGGSLKASTNYSFGNMKGSLLIGGQYEHFSLTSEFDLSGKNFGDIDNGYLTFEDLHEYGKENSLSFFMQDKHYFLPQLILNAGFRYDRKYRLDDKVVKNVSPRLALIYVPHERFSLKLSYSEAFADLAFKYLYEFMAQDNNLSPQHLSALQLTAMGAVSPLHLNYEVNLFYNKYTNLLYWRRRDTDFFENNDKNQGKLKNFGIEANAKYANQRVSAILSLYYCHDASSEYYYYNSDEKSVCGVPHFTMNLHGAYKLIKDKSNELKIYGHSSYIGRKLNYSNEDEAKDFYVDGKLLFDLGILYRFKNRFQLTLDCENILNTDHYICGPNDHFAPYFQRGRSLMASVSYQF